MIIDFVIIVINRNQNRCQFNNLRCIQISIFLFKRHLFKYWSCVWSFAITTCVWLFCIACPCYSDRCTAPRRSSNAADTLKATNKAQLRVRVRTLWKRDEIWGSKGGRAEQNCFFFHLFFFSFLSRKFQQIAQPYIHYYKI